MSLVEDIQKDLNKAKLRITEIDILAAVLQKERELTEVKVWELEYYLDKI